MARRTIAWAIAASFMLAGAVHALDTVRTTNGSKPGRIVATSPTQVDLEQSGATSPREIPVNEIQAVFFDLEPTDLKTAKLHVLAGRYADALTSLERIKRLPNRAEIRDDIEFYKALCAARLALGGHGKPADAGRAMRAFLDAHADSFHGFEAAEIVGDLLVAVGQYASAAEYYAKLEKAPWPDYQMRAGVGIGRSLLAQGKFDEADHAFDKVLAAGTDGDLAQRQRRFAALGKASVRVAAKKPDEAIALVDDLLKTADDKDTTFLARAYNVLGASRRQDGRVNEAILAYLRVELLYPNDPEAHAEALANLADLWQQTRRYDRAERARKTLEEEFPDSPWTKKKDGIRD
jgi:tetratricopeptide (TPR) repeat protein